MSKEFLIGLGNNNPEIRRQADSDFVSFWDAEARKLDWF